MKLNIKSFCLAVFILSTVPALILFIWCSATGFGADIVRLFESIHPSGGLSILSNDAPSFSGHLPGIAVNTLYAAADSFIAGIAFSSLYNFFVSKFGK